MKVGITGVWKIDKSFVVADSIENAIAIYKEYQKSFASYEGIEEIKAIDDMAIYRKEEEE